MIPAVPLVCAVHGLVAYPLPDRLRQLEVRSRPGHKAAKRDILTKCGMVASRIGKAIR